MEPCKDESQKVSEPRNEEKERQRRFQIVKLEERIAPRGPNCAHYNNGKPCSR
jgi:hypothetical protein